MKAVLERLTSDGGKVLVRSASGAVNLISDPGLSSGNALIVEAENVPVFTPIQQVSVWFDSIEGGFFFECLPTIENLKAQLAPGDIIFHQQRRREVRFVVPPGYDVFFALETPENPRLVVKDINQSGVGFEIPQDFPMTVGETIVGTLTVGGHKPVRVTGKARRRQMYQGRVYIGMEFNHPAMGSAGEIAERLLFMRHDVYYMNRSFSHKA